MAFSADRIMMMDTTTKMQGVIDKLDAVKDTWIDWGVGVGQVQGLDMPISATSLLVATDVETGLLEIAGKNFNTRKYISGGIAVVLGNTTAALDALGEVPVEVIAEQSTTNIGVLLGASRIAVGALTTPGSGAALVVENRRILGVLVDAYGDPVLMSTGEQVFTIYETKSVAGVVMSFALNFSQVIFAYADGSGGWKAAAFPGASGNYYVWPVIRFDLNLMPEDAMLYGGGGAESLDNTPYTAGSGIAISGTYAISLGALTGNWDAGNFEIRSLTFQSDVATGISPPFVVASTDKVTNLHADMVDSQHFSTASPEVGDVLYCSSVVAGVSTWTNLNHGLATDYLKSGGHGGAPSWAGVSGVLPPGSVNHEILVWDNPTAWVTTGANFTVDHATGNMYSAGTGDFTGNLDASAGLDVDVDSQKITVGASADWEILHNGTDTVATSKTGDFIIDNTLNTGSTIVRLGDNTAATDFQVQGDNTNAKLTITGSGVTTFVIPDVTATAFLIEDNSGGAFGDDYLLITTSGGTEAMTFGNATTNPDYVFLGGGTFDQSGVGQVTFAGNVNATNGLDVTVAALTVGGGANFSVAPATGNVTGTGAWNAAIIGTVYGGTAQNTSGWTGVPYFSAAGTWNKTATALVRGDIPYASAANTLSLLTIGAAGRVLRSDGTDPSWVASAVVPVSTAQYSILVGNAAGGWVEDTGFKVNTGAVTTGSWTATAIANTYGGTGQNSSGWLGVPYFSAAGTWNHTAGIAAGDLFYGSAISTLAQLAKGTSYQVLRMNVGATVPEWGTAMPIAGGTGQDWSAVAQGSLPYFSAAGTMGTLGIGSAPYQVLRTNLAMTAPEWSSEGMMVTTLVAKSAITAGHVISAVDDAGTGKAEEATANAQTRISVIGVAINGVAGGGTVRYQSHGKVTCVLKSGFTGVTAGELAYLRQDASGNPGYVCRYSEIAYTTGMTILPVGIFLQTQSTLGSDTNILVLFGAAGTQAVLVP